MASKFPHWLWLFGPCGAGKTATGFALYRQLSADGYRVGYVEIDQLGMCLPSPDPTRAPVKIANLTAALRNMHAAAVDGVVVSGDLAGRPMQQLLGLSAERRPVLVRLRATDQEYEQRLTRRGSPQYLESALTYDGRFDRAGDITIDTSGIDVDGVVRRLRHGLGTWPAATIDVPTTSAPLTCGLPGEMVLIAGASPVGKSTVGWELFMRSVAEGVRTAFLDLAQIGHLHGAVDPVDSLGLQARNVAGMWHNFAAEGAQRLILNGDIDGTAQLDALRRALPNMDFRTVILTASCETLVSRALMRSEGVATELPGDVLVGQSRSAVTQHAVAAWQRASALGQISGATYVGTDDRSADVIAHEIADSAFGAAAQIGERPPRRGRPRQTRRLPRATDSAGLSDQPHR